MTRAKFVGTTIEYSNEEVDWRKELRRTCADLIILGHHNVFNYGYSFFKIACKSAKGMMKQQITISMMSIQLAFSKKQEVQKFFRDFEREN